jgi:pimeloyl-ACP methyl ester carboxylesterase
MDMGFQAWKKATLDRLNAGSVVALTPRGAVEYAVAGTGPAVLVIHGRPGGYDQGLVIVRALNDLQLRFIAVSRPGYLRTPLETGRSPEEQADSYAALLDVLGLHRAAVVAFSAGGSSALQFALRHPDRCWGVVLISTLTQRFVGRPALQSQIMNGVWGSSDAMGWLWSGLAECLPRRVARRKSLGLEAVQTLFLYSLRRAGVANDLVQAVQLPQYPLSEIRQPALVIHGTADRFLPCSHAEFAAGAIPHAQMIRIPDGSHFVFFRQYNWLAPKILGFLKTHAPTGFAADAP